jgi:uncharacterized protein (TIGR02611 family)
VKAPEEGGPPRSDMARRLAERRARHRRRSMPYRVGTVVLGFLITTAGVVMTGPIPGPGLLVIPVGLGLLALEFAWAERLLGRTLDYAERSRRRAAEASPAQKWGSAVAAAVAAASFVVAAVLWDIPVLPV